MTNEELRAILRSLGFWRYARFRATTFPVRRGFYLMNSGIVLGALLGAFTARTPPAIFLVLIFALANVMLTSTLLLGFYIQWWQVTRPLAKDS